MLLWFELTKINMEISKPLYVVSVKGTWKFPNPFTLCLWKEHGNAPLRCVCERNMEISKLLYVVSVKGTWKFLSPFTLRCLWKEHGNFQAPLRCVCERNMEISKPLYVVSVKGTWKFPNPFTLYLWKEHGNFQAPLRCVCERNMEISKPFYVVSVKGTWKFPGPFTLRLWKEHGNFQTPWRCICEKNMEISKPLYVVSVKGTWKFPNPFTLCWVSFSNWRRVGPFDMRASTLSQVLAWIAICMCCQVRKLIFAQLAIWNSSFEKSLFVRDIRSPRKNVEGIRRPFIHSKTKGRKSPLLSATFMNGGLSFHTFMWSETSFVSLTDATELHFLERAGFMCSRKTTLTPNSCAFSTIFIEAGFVCAFERSIAPLDDKLVKTFLDSIFPFPVISTKSFEEITNG